MPVTQNQSGREKTPWLFFMFQLPAQGASQRVSVWRKLQKYGALAWKNSAYILPHTPGNLEKFQWLAAEVRKYRGDASIVRVARIEGAPDREIISLFNNARARDYELLVRDLRLALRSAAGRRNAHRPQRWARFNRRLVEIAGIDRFGCGRRREAEKLLKELEARFRLQASPVALRRRRLGTFRDRAWMTRPRPEVDRVASAWLIKNFIDPAAKFVFSADPQAHPDAVRFDMFEGEFTHVGDDCTFETLLKRFALKDKRLRLIAQIVHDADLEDNKFGRKEGKALDLILKGWAKMDWRDEEILKRGFHLYDALYLSLEG